MSRGSAGELRAEAGLQVFGEGSHRRREFARDGGVSQ